MDAPPALGGHTATVKFLGPASRMGLGFLADPSDDPATRRHLGKNDRATKEDLADPPTTCLSSAGARSARPVLAHA
jgi:hypothetical protein